MRIGIIGLGVVGKAIKAYHEGREDEVRSYDKATDAPERFEEVAQWSDVVFICTPTPGTEEGPLDCSSVVESVRRMPEGKTVIIKSTVMPGTTDGLAEERPDLKLFFVPEFLSAKTAEEDYATPKHVCMVGVPGPVRDEWTEQERSAVNALFAFIPTKERRRQEPGISAGALPARQVELLKLARNAFYAFKVCFANALYDLGMSQNAIDCFADDPWIGKQHWTVKKDGYRGYDGACLPKDFRAFDSLFYDGFGCATQAAIFYNEDLIDASNELRTEETEAD